MAERVIMHLDMDAFFASVEQQYHPALRGKPIVVCGNPKKRTVVAACSYEAKAYGIKNGMSVFEARQCCPHVVLVGGDPQKYVELSQRIMALLAACSPHVEVCSIDEAFIDATGTYRFFGQEPETLAAELKRRIRARYGLACSIGIGPNKLIAKIASTLRKPDGLVHVTLEEVAGLMEQLPVEKLCGVGARLKRYLNDLAIVTCADLGRAPEALLTEKFGVIGRLLKRMGQGVDESPVALFEASVPAKSMGHAYTLARDTDDPGEILGTLLRLAEQVARRLRADGYQGRTVSLTIRYADFATAVRHRTLAHPTDSGFLLYQAAAGLFRERCEPLPQRVRLIGVGASQLVRGPRQLSWLDDERRMAWLDRAMDRINDRFGEWTVVRASAQAPLVPKAHGFLQKVALRRSA